MKLDPFARLAAAGREAVLSGRHAVERSPAETGRWGPSSVLLLGGEVGHRLDRLASEAAEVAGEGHWRSGSTGRAHATVRALEPHADGDIPPDRLDRYAAALARAAIGRRPILLTFTGVALTPAGVVATARCADGAADDLRRRLGVELGADGWLEDATLPNGRDPRWYASLLHFAGPIPDARALVDWVEARRDLPTGVASFDAVAVCQWRFDGTAMAPVARASVACSSATASVDDGCAPGRTVHRVTDGESFWDREAATFDREADHGLLDEDVRAAWRTLLLEHLPHPPARVADIGCGTGTLSVLLAHEGYAVTAIDTSSHMLERARGKAEAAGVQVEIRPGDAAGPPLDPGTFDVVLCRHVLWALDDIDAVLGRWTRILRPGGRLVLIEGRWETGGGLGSDFVVGALRRLGHRTLLRPLPDARPWGRPISDDRYLVVGTI